MQFLPIFLDIKNKSCLVVGGGEVALRKVTSLLRSGAKVDLVWKTRDPVRSDHGMCLVPSATFDGVERVDLVCVPGGPGVAALMEDEQTLDFLRRVAPGARYVTSVCTGALVLGAAGLLRGRQATTHWLSLELLVPFGATPVAERVVRDFTCVGG